MAGATSRVAGRDVPGGWRVVERRRAGPFTTSATLETPGGQRVRWTSRRHRKGLGLVPVDGRSDVGRRRASATSVALALLFGIGSICFALGSLPLYFDAVAPSTTAATFFVGSLFFTTAAAVQLHECMEAPDGVHPGSHRPGRVAAIVRWRPRSIDWWASAVQFAGTILFNVSTWSATSDDLDLAAEQHLIWAPEVWGSVCFLVASALAYREVNEGVLPRADESVGWRIAALNMAGSIAFGLSAVAGRYLTTTGEPANITAVNLFTFVGALGFLAGAVLLPVESRRDDGVHDPDDAAVGQGAVGRGRYELIVAGRPGAFLSAALDGFEVTERDATTIQVVGDVADQAALHGVLHRLQDLRADIIAVRRIGP